MNLLINNLDVSCQNKFALNKINILPLTHLCLKSINMRKIIFQGNWDGNFHFITFPWIVCNFLFIFIFYLWWVIIIATIFPVISLSSSWWWWQFPLCRVSSDSTWNILFEGDYLFCIVEGGGRRGRKK